MIYCKELDKSFATKEELFTALKLSKDLIISEKKAQIYKSCDKGLGVYSNQERISKTLEISKSFEMNNDYYYFVVNSSRILDSHKDVHIDGNWDKTVKEQQGRVYLVFDHTLKRSEVIAMKESVEMFTATIPFSMIGKDYDGETYALIYKVKKDRIVNQEAKDWLDKGFELEASVRMQYVDIELALNSNDKNDVKEKETFDKYYSIIANKSDHESIDYFWVVKQAKNVLESSLVLFGSNSATGQIQENKEDIEAVDDTSKNEPSEDTQQTEEIPTEKRKLSII